MDRKDLVTKAPGIVVWLFGDQPAFQSDSFSAFVIALIAFWARLGVGERAWDFVSQLIVFLLLAATLKPRIYRFFDERAIKFQPIVSNVLLATIATAIVGGLSWVISKAAGLEPLPRLVLVFDFVLSAVYLIATRGLGGRLLLPKPHLRFSRNDEIGESRTREFILAFVVLFLFGLVLVWKALPYPMAWDDLHLIRPFSAANMADAFGGNWDPDRIETDGYRPVTMLFNHVRYMLLGENVAMHRLLLVGMYALFLAMLSWVANQFDMPWKFTLLAGVLSMAARHNIYHYIWLVDGIHLLQGVLLGAGLVCAIKFFQGKGNIYFDYAVAFCIVNLLAREDSVIALAIIPLICLAYLRLKNGASEQYGELRSLTIVLGIVGAVTFYVRSQAVPNAEGTVLELQGLLNVIASTIFGFMGWQSFDPWSAGFQVVWAVIVALTLVAAAFLLARYRNPIAALWLLPAVVACLVGLSNDRVNLLLFPITFFGFFLGAVWWQLELKLPLFKFAALGAAAIGIVGAAYVSSVAIEAFHPQSAAVVYWNSELIFGRYAEKATIPEAREQAAAAALLQYGINSPDDIPPTYQLALEEPGDDLFSQLVQAALRANRRRPNVSGDLFVPWLEPLSE